MRMESYPKFHNEVGAPIVRIGCREFKCMGISRRKIIRTSTSIWVRLARSFARIARRYSVSIRVGPHEAAPADRAYSDMEDGRTAGD